MPQMSMTRFVPGGSPSLYVGRIVINILNMQIFQMFHEFIDANCFEEIVSKPKLNLLSQLHEKLESFMF